MQEDVKSIKVSLPYCEADGKLTVREQTISFKKAIEKDGDFGLGLGLTGKLIYWSMGISLVLPNHIHEKIKGSYVGRKTDRREYINYDTDFKKTITSDSLEGLTKRYRDIVLDYKWIIDIETMVLTKVIFFNFDGYVNEQTKSQWNGIKFGKDLEIKYGYVIGYVSQDGKTRFNSQKKSFHYSYDKFINEWGYVEYTEKRDIFFSAIYSKFQGIIQELKRFEDSLSEKTIDNIISSQPKLLSI